jgi:chromosome segregation ATPase
MSSNQTSEEDLLNSQKANSKFQTPLSHSFLTDSQTADLKSTLLTLRASLRQKEEEIISLRSLNENLKSSLKSQKDLDNQLKAEVIQHTQKRKELEEVLKQVRSDRGEDKVEIRRLATQKENLASEVEELRENVQFLEYEVKELRRENEQLKERNSNVEKDKYVLQCNMDKLNRMLTRESAESKRYRSLIDLQKNAINDLQRDYNKVIIDLSNQENVSMVALL